MRDKEDNRRENVVELNSISSAESQVNPYHCVTCGASFTNEQVAEAHTFVSPTHEGSNTDKIIRYKGSTVKEEESLKEPIDKEKNSITVEEKQKLEKPIHDSNIRSILKYEGVKLKQEDTEEFINKLLYCVSYLNRTYQKQEIKEAIEDVFKIEREKNESLTTLEENVLELHNERGDRPEEIAEELGIDRMHTQRIIDRYKDDQTILCKYDLTDTQEEIIDYIAENPNAKNEEISDEVGCSISYPSQIKANHMDIITERAEELGTNLAELEQSEKKRKNRLAKTWDELSSKQAEVLERLSEEPNPSDPDSSYGEIVNDMSFKTHKAYIVDVISKYAHFAEKLKNDDIDITQNQKREKRNDDQEDMTAILSFIEENKRVAREEIENTENGSEQNKIAKGRLIFAKQFEDKINDELN